MSSAFCTKYQSQSPKTATIVIPTYHENENIRYLISQIYTSVSPQDFSVKCLIVDDDSRDGTIESIKQLQAEGYYVEMLNRRGQKRDLSCAVMEGFERADGQVVVCMDADLQVSHIPLDSCCKFVRFSLSYN
jgi:dolichol-phosphate mannosyltransferase